MSQDNSLAIPSHVAAKIERVLGVQPSELDGYDMVSLIEELCDTALMFEQEERGAAQSDQKPPAGGTTVPAPNSPELRLKRHMPNSQSGNKEGAS